MELGIAGRRAIVCGGSKGLGRAAALAPAREGVEVVLIARTARSLKDAAEEIAAETGIKVMFTATDITTLEGQTAVIAACPDADILVTNPGVRQTPADFRTLSREEWLKWLDMHFFSALEMIRGVVPGMAERRFGRVVNISVSNIKFPQVNFGHSHGARLALAGAIASMVRELIPHNVTINSVCPGFFDTEALRTNLHNHAARQHHVRGDRRRPPEDDSRGRLRRSAGVRRSHRFPVRGAERLHHGPGHRQRRRRLSGSLLGKSLPARSLPARSFPA
jgi:3-oxoacyl-[acyl-carrier protein] reductase